MKKIYLTVTLLALFISEISGQGVFQKTISGNGDIWAHCVRQTTDSGYVICGNVNTGVDFDILVIKMDQTGQIQWSRRLGDMGDDYGYSIIQDIDGGYVVSGLVTDLLIQQQIETVFKLNASGNTIWSLYTGVDTVVTSIQLTLDSAYILSGFENTGIPGLFVFKINSSGNLLWCKRILDVDECYNIGLSNDGGFILSGQSNAGAGSQDMILIKIDSVGNIVWSKTYGSNQTDQGYSAKQTLDNGYIIAGATSGFGIGWKTYLVKTDSIGNLIWSKTYDPIAGSSTGKSVFQTSDGGFVLSGSFGSGIQIIRLNANGDTLWTKGMSNGLVYTATDAVQLLNDGGLIIAGKDFNTINYEMRVFKTDSLGSINCNEYFIDIVDSNPSTIVTNVSLVASLISLNPYFKTISNQNYNLSTSLCSTFLEESISIEDNIVVIPNPFSNEIKFQTPFNKGTVIIYNSLGNEIMSHPISSTETKLNTEKLNPGFYFLKYIEEGKTTGIKLAKF